MVPILTTIKSTLSGQASALEVGLAVTRNKGNRKHDEMVDDSLQPILNVNSDSLLKVIGENLTLLLAVRAAYIEVQRVSPTKPTSRVRSPAL